MKGCVWVCLCCGSQTGIFPVYFSFLIYLLYSLYKEWEKLIYFKINFIYSFVYGYGISSIGTGIWGT